MNWDALMSDRPSDSKAPARSRVAKTPLRPTGRYQRASMVPLLNVWSDDDKKTRNELLSSLRSTKPRLGLKASSVRTRVYCALAIPSRAGRKIWSRSSCLQRLNTAHKSAGWAIVYPYSRLYAARRVRFAERSLVAEARPPNRVDRKYA